jgi:hypothetical protein
MPLSRGEHDYWCVSSECKGKPTNLLRRIPEKKRPRTSRDRTKSELPDLGTPELVRGGLGLIRGLHTDETSVTSLVFELHDAGYERKQRVVLALADVDASLMLRAALPNQNRSCVDELSAKTLYAKSLPV